jgi:hypothetical protein
MATAEELAKQYAEKVRQAIKVEGRTKATTLTAWTVGSSCVAQAFIDIADDLSNYKVIDSRTNGARALNDDEIRSITTMAGENLGIADPADFYHATHGALTSSYMQMITFIGNVVKKSN